MRTLRYEDWWGDDGDVLIVFGHVDRDELYAAAEAWCRAEWGLWWDEMGVVFPRHVYAVPTGDEYEPHLHWQTEPEHPAIGYDPVPITIAPSLGSACRIPACAELPVTWRVDFDRGAVLIADQSEPQPQRRPPHPLDRLADRLIAKSVHP